MNKFEFEVPNEEYFFPCCMCKNKRAEAKECKECKGYNLPQMKEYDMINEIKEILEKGINKEN